MPNMGGASYRLQVRCSACVSACTVAALLKAKSGTGVVNVACRERKKMATAPEESATAELKQLSINDPDYNPFSDEDIQKILHEEQNNSAEEGWAFTKRNEFCEIWRKNERDKPVHLIKGYLNFPGIPAEKVVEMIYDLDVRKNWDKQFPTIDVLEEKKHYRVVYWVVKMPPLVADRDIVQFIGRRYDDNTNTTYILYRNASHPDRPERKGLVRGETILSGVIIRPDPEDPTNSSRLSLMLQNDIKGWVPHFVVNAFAARAPLEWRESLANYYHNVYTKKDEKEDEGGQGTTTEGAAEGQSTTAEGGDEGTKDKGQSSSADAEEEEAGQSADGDVTEGGGEAEKKGEDDQQVETTAEQ